MMTKDKATVGQWVMCNGYKGCIRVVHTGQLDGMATVQLKGGQTCVPISELVAIERPNIFQIR